MLRHLPNALTVLRFILIPVLVALLLRDRFETAFAVFAVSALSDLADGVVARRWNLRTRFGAIADPLADKLTMLSVALALAAQSLIPLWLVLAIVARDALIVGGAVAYHYVVGRYDMAPSRLSKLNTAVQFAALSAVLADGAGVIELSVWLPGLFALLLATIVASGAQYVWVWGRRALLARRTS
ncbi:MAG TPA: CDP-alcohol phosphatidyltransferase family protein [Burkholderiales bacterium]|nr:CDP-alcohol phosphatidyltransferase family protein [Burkholderiales bacterium]